jgi:capsular polysaccharide export protein
MRLAVQRINKTPPGKRRFLFLQGPISPFFAEVAAGLRGLGHEVFRINLNLGDRLFWRGPGGVDFTAKPDAWRPWIEAFLDQQAISDLVLLGEQRFYHQEAIAAAKARGLAITVTEWGYLRPDWIILERDGTGGESLFPRDPATILHKAEGLPAPDLRRCFADHFPSQAFWDIAYHAALLFPAPFRHFRNHEVVHPLATYAGIGRRLLLRPMEDRRSTRILADLLGRRVAFWVFAMQIENDFSLRAYSSYRGMDAALQKAMASFAAHAPSDGELLIKLHPLDPCVKNWPTRIAAMARKLGLGGRVHVAPRGDLDAMLQAARGMIAVNSTAASRALALNKPVKLLGQSVFNIPGLVFQGALDAFWTKAEAPDAALRDAFFALLCAAFMVRGVYFAREGRSAAVRATVERLDRGLINLPLPAPLPETRGACWP